MPFIGNQLSTSFQNVETQTITGDGSTSYTLNNAVADGKDLLVYINNVKQEEGSGKSYTATGTTITFTEAVASTDSCYVVFIGQAIGTVTPKDGSIVSSMLADANLEMPNTLDLNGKELILDADADTSITADTDDQIDIKIAGSDNIRIKANEIENVSGDFTLDVAGDISFDADGGQIRVKDGGTEFGVFSNVSSDFIIASQVQDKDIIFQGNDGGSGIEAARFDMSEGGRLYVGKTSGGTANVGVEARGDGLLLSTRDGDVCSILRRNSDDGEILRFQQAGTTVGSIFSSSGNLVIDSPADIILDADGGDVNFQDGGTVYGFLAKSSDNLLIGNSISDGDVLIRGNDGGSNITALEFDMSAGGEAFFNNDVNVTFQRGYQVEGGTGNNKVRFTTTTGDGGANTVLVYWTATYGNDMSGGCLGAYSRSSVYSAPSATISSSNQFAIYGVIGIS